MESVVSGVNKVKLNSLDTAERKICDGQVVLFKRQGSKRWQARIRRKIGTWGLDLFAWPQFLQYAQYGHYHA